MNEYEIDRATLRVGLDLVLYEAAKEHLKILGFTGSPSTLAVWALAYSWKYNN